MRPQALVAALAALALACPGLVGCQPLRSSAPVTLRIEPATPISWETIGTSREGRPVHAQTLGLGGRRVALLANIHGNEQEGLRHLDEFVPILGRAAARVRLIEDVNPDGTATSRRTTSSGVDPNRNWPASNFKRDPRNGPDPLSEPAVAAVHRDLAAFRPELVIVLHSTARGPFVNYDGPAERDAQRFADAACWSVVPSMGYPTPGSLGTFMGVDRGIPILTIEFRRGAPRSETGPALLRGLTAVLDPSAPMRAQGEPVFRVD